MISTKNLSLAFIGASSCYTAYAESKKIPDAYQGLVYKTTQGFSEQRKLFNIFKHKKNTTNKIHDQLVDLSRKKISVELLKAEVLAYDFLPKILTAASGVFIWCTKALPHHTVIALLSCTPLCLRIFANFSPEAFGVSKEIKGLWKERLSALTEAEIFTNFPSVTFRVPKEVQDHWNKGLSILTDTSIIATQALWISGLSLACLKGCIFAPSALTIIGPALLSTAYIMKQLGDRTLGASAAPSSHYENKYWDSQWKNTLNYQQETKTLDQFLVRHAICLYSEDEELLKKLDDLISSIPAENEDKALTISHNEEKSLRKELSQHTDNQIEKAPVRTDNLISSDSSQNYLSLNTDIEFPTALLKEMNSHKIKVGMNFDNNLFYAFSHMNQKKETIMILRQITDSKRNWLWKIEGTPFDHLKFLSKKPFRLEGEVLSLISNEIQRRYEKVSDEKIEKLQLRGTILEETAEQKKLRTQLIENAYFTRNPQVKIGESIFDGLSRLTEYKSLDNVPIFSKYPSCKTVADIIKKIKISDITESFMRGFDQEGKPFFIIKSLSENETQNPQIQIFYPLSENQWEACTKGKENFARTNGNPHIVHDLNNLYIEKPKSGREDNVRAFVKLSISNEELDGVEKDTFSLKAEHFILNGTRWESIYDLADPVEVPRI